MPCGLRVVFQQPARVDIVHIVYLDDSKQETIRDQKYQVIGAVIIPDRDFSMIEQTLAYYVYEQVPEELRNNFEFHASDIWSGAKPFDSISQPERHRLFGECVRVLEEWKVPIVYGAVDLCRLYGTLYSTANPVDIAFRTCAIGIEEWFRSQSSTGLGLIVSDDTAKQHVKNAILNAFRQYRQFVRSSPSVRGLLAHIHDDMYFGDSKYSVGIQLADMCTLLISRHLAGFEDSEELYKRIEKLIFKGAIEPSEKS
jgi:hypothetical protein